MSTVAEIVEAVKRLPPEQKLELVQKLDSVLFEPAGDGGKLSASDYRSSEFTKRLVEHFHRAKRTALGQG
jgi:hypothetical protein